MKYTQLGNTGYQISRIAYGGIVSMDDGQEASDRYVAWAIDQGVNYFDVAPALAYGDAQEKMGNSLVPYRKNVYLACKTENRRYAEAEKDLIGSLKMLHTDYLDVYQMHHMETVEDVETAFGPNGVMELMVKLKKEGVVRRIGMSVHNEEIGLMALERYPFDTVLYPFNWHMNMAHGAGNALIEKRGEKGFGLLCMKSMIERAWKDGDEQAKAKFHKSWCKPIDPDEDAELLLAAMKYALSLGVDTLIPPGNYRHFSFAVEHLDKALEPMTDREKQLLASRLETVKDYPFFVNGLPA